MYPGQPTGLTDIHSFMKSIILFLGGILLPAVIFAQASLSGKIVNEQGEPIAGANVILKATYYGTSSDASGRYEFSQLPEGDYDLRVSFIGFGLGIKSIHVIDKPVEADFQLKESYFLTDEAIVVAVRAGDKTPTSFINLNKEEIEANNLGMDMPYMLERTPSVVVTSDAGTGIGYTGLRIRGTDPTRINVTINGIPLNDAESQGVFWVNMPDFASSTDNIQIQRGVGTSSNGAGAFGGSINLQTNTLRKDAYGEVNTTYGSFNTWKNNASFGTGLIGKHWTLDGRLSRISSDGYIDRATSDLRSYFLSGGYVSGKTAVRANLFSGHEITYQAWDGVPSDSLKTNRTFNGTGTDGGQKIPAHDNEVDDYTQTHYQLILTQGLTSKLTFNAALHLTQGAGFFEQYKAGQSFADYQLANVRIGSDTITETDLIRRRWLDNDFYGTTYSFSYNDNGQLQIIVGGAWNRYEGKHFGEVIWAEFNSNGLQGHRYYDNDAVKTDFNNFVKANYQVTNRLNAFADLQYRSVNYEFLGFDNDGNNVTQDDQLSFFNPKAGLTYDLNGANRFFVSYAVGNKEPNRNDYTESTPNSRPEYETLYDIEAGYKWNARKASLALNVYRMDYDNQLVLNGQLNDVGAATRINVDKSYRMGAELVWGLQLTPWMNWNANATLSQNKIESFTEYVDDWDTGEQLVFDRKNTDLAYSPSIIGGSDLTARIYESKGDDVAKNQLVSLSLMSKYVGKQFIDNTGSDERSLDAYLVNDIRFSYRIKNLLFEEIALTFMVRNVLGEMYSSNAWVYRYNFGGELQSLDGFFPQAGRNYMLGLKLTF